MIATRRTYNGNADWVYPFPLSLLQSCHRLGGVKVALHGPGMALTACNAICSRQDRLEESEHVGRPARVVDRDLMLRQVIHS
jgi:hypothetical protein